MEQKVSKIQLRQDTQINFEDTILALGEPAWTIDTHVLKIGDGEHKFKELSAIGDGTFREPLIANSVYGRKKGEWVEVYAKEILDEKLDAIIDIIGGVNSKGEIVESTIQSPTVDIIFDQSIQNRLTSLLEEYVTNTSLIEELNKKLDKVNNIGKNKQKVYGVKSNDEGTTTQIAIELSNIASPNSIPFYDDDSRLTTANANLTSIENYSDGNTVVNKNNLIYIYRLLLNKIIKQNETILLSESLQNKNDTCLEAIIQSIYQQDKNNNTPGNLTLSLIDNYEFQISKLMTHIALVYENNSGVTITDTTKVLNKGIYKFNLVNKNEVIDNQNNESIITYTYSSNNLTLVFKRIQSGVDTIHYTLDLKEVDNVIDNSDIVTQISQSHFVDSTTGESSKLTDIKGSISLYY